MIIAHAGRRKVVTQVEVMTRAPVKPELQVKHSVAPDKVRPGDPEGNPGVDEWEEFDYLDR